MKKSRVVILILAILLGSCQKSTEPTQTVISNVNIIDIKTGNILEHQDIWIRNDRILKITSSNPDQHKGNFIIDATGNYIIPSLWDMHAHLWGQDWVFDRYTALGISGLRCMNGSDKRIEDIKKNRKDGFYRGFEFLYSSPITDGPGENWGNSRVASNPEEGRQLVREYYEKGYDFVKVYNFLDYDTYMAIADECTKLNFPFAGHVPGAVTVEEAINAGQKSIEHGTGIELAVPDIKSFKQKHAGLNLYEYYNEFFTQYDSSLMNQALQITSSQDTWFCPTMVLNKSFIITEEQDSIFKNDPRLKYIPQEEQDYWFGVAKDEGTPDYLGTNKDWAEMELKTFKLNISYLKPMLDKGTRFLAGTDPGNPNIYPGFSLHDELQLFVEAGFTELQALQTATINPAIYADRENELGTIEEGKIANILILDKNPIENIRNTLTINGLIRRGQYLSKTELNKLLNTKN